MHCGKPLREETEEYCADCSSRKSNFVKGRGLWVHQGIVSDAVYRFKYKNKRCYAPVFARELANAFLPQLLAWEIEEIIPIPLHYTRRRKRGYNQTELLADELSYLTGIPVRKNNLLRIKRTIAQKQVGGKQREENLEGAFAVVKKWDPPGNVLLLDDIYTTGSTIERAAKMLKMAGVENVYFLTISIGQGV